MEVGYSGLDVTFDYALSKMDGAGQMASVPLGLLPHIHQHDALARVESSCNGISGGFGDALASCIDELDESGTVPRGHQVREGGVNIELVNPRVCSE
ncbi:MAG: hypothetical protein Rubg2KO_16530 [Rubricoccaceae bacterium]